MLGSAFVSKFGVQVLHCKSKEKAPWSLFCSFCKTCLNSMIQVPDGGLKV